MKSQLITYNTIISAEHACHNRRSKHLLYRGKYLQLSSWPAVHVHSITISNALLPRHFFVAAAKHFKLSS